MRKTFDRRTVQKSRWRLILALLVLSGIGILIVVSLTSAQSNLQVRPGRRWSPRQSIAGESFVGDQVCAQCHKKIMASFTESPMRRAMESVADSRVLLSNPVMTFRNGSYSYSIKREGKKSLYTVTDGKQSVTVPVLYAFGQGRAGQTYILQYKDKLYESLVSFYQEVPGLDFTVGASDKIPSSLEEALGKPLSAGETKDCFGCHASGALVDGKVNLEKAVPGIHCEACHGPGGAHAEAIQSGEPGASLIFNPKAFSGDELSQEFCAACHRAIPDFEKLRSLKVNNVRFQPYRIFYSKCYSDDRRITCTGCHNPHEPVRKEMAYYDARCLACHTIAAKAGDKSSLTGASATMAQGSAPSCKVSTKDCISCHMQKVAPPQAHFKFTDHYIRIVKASAPYPD